jgi:outer membrane cobalamin receptor
MTSRSPFHLLICILAAAGVLAGETFQGKIVDISGAPIPGAQVAAVNRLGVITQTVTDAIGEFRLSVPPSDSASFRITAPGFETKTVPPAESKLVVLAIAPQTDSVQVVGSAIDVPLREQGSSVSVITHEEIEQRNEPRAIDLLRYLPGLSVTQIGARGSLASLFIRGGDSNFNLVEIDGVTVNAFGGGFDFANLPVEFLDRIEVVRGPQSAVYGAYANSGVVNFVTRSPEEKANFEVLAEGGSHAERRFSAGASGVLLGFGIAAFASQLDDNGPVANSDDHDKDVFLALTRTMGRHHFAANGHFNASEVGVPGAYGSNPVGLFTGLDLISRNKTNFSNYGGHYQVDISPRVRQELFAGFFLNNSFFQSPFGPSYNKDLRGQAEERTVLSVSSHYLIAVGYAASREEVKNTFITDTSARSFPLRRDQHGIYWENRFEFGGRLFANLGARAEIIRTPRIPADTFAGRPEFRQDTLVKVNPKIAIAYELRPGTRLHSSAATGIRPPSGFDIAFTDNPRLKPERTASFDVGLEQRLYRQLVSLEGTYFYNRYYDLIVSLGGNLARLSSYQSDNLANSRAQGAEFIARIRPVRWISVAGSYTYLASDILSLSGSSGLAPAFFKVGQPLIRRPRHSGALVATVTRHRFSANVTGYFRGTALDVEPNFGASAGLFKNLGYANLGINVNYNLARGFTLYGNLRNALNRRYEEAFGFPSPLLNFVSGVKWDFSRAK